MHLNILASEWFVLVVLVLALLLHYRQVLGWYQNLVFGSKIYLIGV
jgi:hypothetical protein